MRILLIVQFCLLVSWSVSALAVLPENGLYYNPNYSGSGYSVEVQGTTLVLITFSYDRDTGAPLFYYAAGGITQAEPESSGIFGAQTAPKAHESAYAFDAPMYRFAVGPCITCLVPNWDTSEHAIEAGHVKLRMADVNRITATFTLADGSSKTTELWRMGFGRRGYQLDRPDDRSLPDMRGEWIFVQPSDPQGPVWDFNFNKVGEVQHDNIAFYGRGLSSSITFTDTDSGATLTCVRYGCAVKQDSDTLFLVKFRDIGMDRLVGYSGQELYPDDGSAGTYRGSPLVVGRHIVNPTPDAAPPPDELN